MRRRHVLRGLAASVAMAGMLMLTGCGLIGNSISYRYRMTVEVDTPQGLKRGSSVIQVDKSEGRGLEGSHIDTRVTGEAVAVDLGGGRTMFALLDRAAVVARDAIDPHLPELPNSDDDWWKGDAERLRAQTAVFELPRMGRSPFGVNKMENQWPTLVHFRDLRDPQSEEGVDPDNAAATLGAGVRIRRITVQMTDDPVTTGIEKRLRWLDHLDQYRTVKTNPYTSTLPQEIGKLRLNGDLV